MANYQKCSQGHFYDADKDTVCPICKSGKGIYSKISLAISGVVILIAAFLFYSLEETKTNLENVEQRLEKYSELEKVFGRASDDYFADQSVLVLKENGAEGKITVCWNKSSEENASAILSSSNKDIEAKWESNFNENTHLANVVVTPSKAGIYRLYFSNKIDDDKFEVLVVVK